MKLQISQNESDIVVIPSIYKDMEKPPTFIFKSPNSQDCLNFMFGGNNVFEAVCNCFIGFENKIELYNGDNEIKYTDYREFVNAGVSGDIAVIHNECMNAVANRLTQMIEDAKKTEKKSQSPMNSTKKEQGTKETTLKDTATKRQSREQPKTP